jgi:hypothetical protein
VFKAFGQLILKQFPLKKKTEQDIHMLRIYQYIEQGKKKQLHKCHGYRSIHEFSPTKK